MDKNKPFLGVILVVTFALSSVSAQPFDDEPTIGEVIGAQLGDALRSRQEAIANKQLFERELWSARERFWECYPSCAQRKQIEAEFADHLYSKDFYYLILFLPEGTIDSLRQTEALTGGAIDGGIRGSCLDVFKNWGYRVRTLTGARSQTGIYLPDFSKMPQALEASVPEYSRYKSCRDEEEYRTATVVLAPRTQGSPGPVVDRPPDLDSGEARAIYMDGLGAYSRSDYARARELFDRACDLGNATACEHAGLMFRIGRGGPRDEERALERFERACEGESPMGCEYLDGFPVERQRRKGR